MSERIDALVGRLWENAGRCIYWAQKMNITSLHAGINIVEAIDVIEAQQDVVKAARLAGKVSPTALNDILLEALVAFDAVIERQDVGVKSKAMADALAQAASGGTSS